MSAVNQLLARALRLQTLCGSGGFGSSRDPGSLQMRASGGKFLHAELRREREHEGLFVFVRLPGDELGWFLAPLCDPIKAAAAAEDGRLYLKWCI